MQRSRCQLQGESGWIYRETVEQPGLSTYTVAGVRMLTEDRCKSGRGPFP